jgi:asparagine synthase (glutamine-hydrolysing)
VGFGGTRIELKSEDWWAGERDGSEQVDAAGVRERVMDSVRRHLRSDVPICTLLSGGLDSTIITTAARGMEPGLDLCTYCAGADAPEGDDLPVARRIAAALNTRHTEAKITREHFAQRWPEMVRATGLPMGTPNEVAINEVSRRLRADGKIVALSGEGADELFAGYEAPLEAAARAAEASGADWLGQGGATQLELAAWIPTGAKEQILSPGVWAGLESDAVLREHYRDEFVRVATLAEVEDAMAAHQCFIRRINLSGLLLRLDQSTMLESVEGRTPLADQSLAAMAEAMPMAARYSPGAKPPRTKLILREAFAGMIDAEALTRPKASFPLPFQEWAADNAGSLSRSRLAKEVFSPLALASVTANPRELWRVAWPMINIALWGERWWK